MESDTGNHKIMQNTSEFEAHIWQQPPEAYQGKVPFIVSDLIEQLTKLNAQNVEGIFRLNGSDRLTKELIEEMDTRRITDWSKYQNVHTLATALKRYFRTMSTTDPIVPFRLYNDLIRAGKESNSQNSIKEVLKKLDKGRYNTLSYLIKFLNFISQHSNENKMTPQNLGVCFGPNLIVSDRPDSVNALNDSIVVVNILDTMITNYFDIFDNAESVGNCLCDDEDIAAVTLPPLAWSHVVILMTRTKMRTQYKTIPYVPQTNMQMGILMNRPNRSPPPILADEEDVVAEIRNGFSDFYGDAVGMQNTEILIQSITDKAPVINLPTVAQEEAILGFDQPVVVDEPAVNEKENEPKVVKPKPVLSQEELFIPNTENMQPRRAANKKGRRPPTRH